MNIANAVKERTRRHPKTVVRPFWETSFEEGDFGSVTVHRSPIRAFLEIPISGDSLYQTLEIQLLETTGSRGCIVHLLDHDRRLDVYAPESLGLDDQWFEQDASTSHMNRGELCLWPTGEGTADEHAGLSWDKSRIEGTANFVDRHGRRVSVRATAARQPRWRWGNVFTPAPATVTDPKLLRLLLMREFWLLPREAAVSVQIDGVNLTPKDFPIPIGGKRRLHARFASGISLLAVNQQFVDAHPAIESLPLTLIETDGPAVAALSTSTRHDPLVISFSPPLTSDPSRGDLEFRFRGQRVGGGQYRYEPDRDVDAMKWSNIDQNWYPRRPWPSAVAVEMARRVKRRSVRYHWSSGAANWRLGQRN